MSLGHSATRAPANGDVQIAVEAMRQACFDAVRSNPKNALGAILRIDAAEVITAPIKSNGEAVQLLAMAHLREMLSRKAANTAGQVSK